MSQPNSAGGYPTSFNTNVNRAKTQKWVEAKSYSYDGDDWGEVDEYDEYGGHNRPEPASTPTGLRQRGQSATQAPQEEYGARQDLYQSPVDARQPYGQMGGPSSQQLYGGHSNTNPPPQHQPTLVRTNSFDQGDERRAHLAGGVQTGTTSTAGFDAALQGRGHTPAVQDFQHAPMYPSQPPPAQPSPGGSMLQSPSRSSMDGQVRYTEQVQSMGGTFRGPAYLDQQRQGSRTHSMTSNTSSQDFLNRRDFSPSAMPPPLQTRGSPSPHGNPDSRSSSRHPLRKSSLSQDNAPTQPFSTQGPPMTMAKDPEEDLYAASDRASSGAGKPLPFVRPADIYRRMNEEKEKERQSQESSRPSMDSITGKTNDRPVLGKASDTEQTQRLKPMLDPVSERRSEYGMEGIDVNDQEDVGERRPTTSKTFELPKRAPNSASQSSTVSMGPILPDVSRVSGFGESFFGSGNNFTTPIMNFTNSTPQTPFQEPKQGALEKDLQHQPSLGFTSAVHHAFDKAEDQVPPTPSSATNSTIGRSASGGTSAVSPIISRGPSTATDRLPGIEDVSTPSIIEEPGANSSRSRSSGSPDTARQLERKPSLSKGVASDLMQTRNDLPPLFVPGHRRDLSTPSPDNSPARVPALEANRQLRQPQEVELSAATPTEQGFSTTTSPQNSAIEHEVVPAVLLENHSRERDTQLTSGNLPGILDQTFSPISPQYLRNRTDSPSSSRVRNIADQFESGSRPGSAHSTTPRASLLSSATRKEDGFAPPRPIADRMESFRPHLPGGWESSTSMTPTPGAKEVGKTAMIPRSEQMETSNPSSPGLSTLPNKPDKGMSILPSDNNTPPISQIKDASAEAFTAVAAAGTALAGAFASAVGMDQYDSSTASSSDGQGRQRESEDSGPEFRAHNPSVNTIVHPEASRPSLPNLTDDQILSAAPTPLPRNTQQEPAMDAAEPEYFPSPLSVHQGPSKQASQIEGSNPTKLQATLPLLSTDLQSQQYESDRLRKEIVRELTPMSASEPTTAETDYSNYQSLATNPSVVRPDRGSGVLPREYESYWNDENSDEEVSEISREPTQIEHPVSAERPQATTGVSEPLHSAVSPQMAALVHVSQGEPSQDRPHVLPHRFSWEQPLHDLSVGSKPPQTAPMAPTSDFLRSTIYPQGHSFQPKDGPSETDKRAVTPAGQPTIVNEIPISLDKVPPIPFSSITTDQENESIDSHKGAADFPSGLEVAQSRGERVPEGVTVSSHDEKIDTLGPQSSIGEMDQRDKPEIPLLEASRSDDLKSTVPDLYLPSTGPPIPSKIPAFREIVALKTTSERIRGFNDARQQFAGLSVGLDDWITQTVYDLPEHADILAMSGRPAPNFQGHRPSPSRSKLGGLLPGGGQSGQQPYFQQYLNASPQSLAPHGSAQGGAVGGISPQASSPSGGSGGKISSQQVQAKGKDLLHTAGVFGGKANVAAKGLFSKGKSKFRAASGAEKATNSSPSSPSLSRGMQMQPPDLQSRSTTQTPKDLHVGPSPGAIQAVSPNLQRSPRTPEHESLQDSPSLESFSQSQLGDDERSEESGRTSQDNPPVSSLCGGVSASSHKEEHQAQAAANAGDSPVLLQKTRSAASYIGSQNEIPTPRSAASSNRTPTQATFAAQTQLTQSPIEDTLKTSEAQEKLGTAQGEEERPKSIFQPQSSLRQVPQTSNTFGIVSHGSHVPVTDTTQIISGVSNDKLCNADSQKDPIVPSLTGAQPAGLQEDKTQPQISTRMGALIQSEKFESLPLKKLTEDLGDRQNGTRTIPAPPLGTSHHSLRPSQELAHRGPSIDGSLSRTNLDLPPSLMSPPPHQSTIRDTLEVSRTGPIHYGIDHDFISDSNNGNLRNQSPSYPGSFPNRTSLDSRRSLEPNTFMDSAFWHSDQSRGTDLATTSNPGHIAVDESHTTRHPAASSRTGEPELSGERHSSSKPRSRRGSRSSAFFKAIGRPFESDQPHLPNVVQQQQEVSSPVERRSGSKSRSRRGSNSSPLPKAYSRPLESDHPSPPHIDGNQISSTPIDSPAAEEKKGRRTTLLRSLKRTSASGSGSGRSKENISRTKTTPQSIRPVQTFPTTSQQMNENPSKGSSTTIKSNKKLQRASTSGNLEQGGSKKKRFSAIGSLFGRSNLDRQSPVEHAAGAPQQPSPTPLQQRYYGMPQLSQSRQHDESPMEQPPPGGYYAPPSLDSRPSQSSNGHVASGTRIQQSSWAQDTPAYVHDSSLRQRADPVSSQQIQPRPGTVTTTTTTFSRRPQPPPSALPHSTPAARASTSSPRTNAEYSAPPVPTIPSRRSREALPQQSAPEPQPSGNSWTRFSSHSRSKSRNSQNPPPSSSNGTAFPAPPFNTPNTPQNATTRQPFQPTPRSDSPPPPPLPPKDNWHASRPRQSTFSTTTTTTTMHHSHNPSQVSALSIRPISAEPQSRPVSTGNRHSLPPLQTDLIGNRSSAVKPAAKTTMPPADDDDRRKSRQQQIERSTLPSADMHGASGSAGGLEVRRDSEDERPVMSATSFPGQMWQPDYAHWDAE